MSTPKELIDETMSFYDGIDEADGDNAQRRRHLLHFLRHIHSTVHNFRSWTWTWKETEITINAANSLPIATAIPDFLTFGRQGLIYARDTPGFKLRPRPPYEVQRIRRSNPSGALQGYPFFAIYDGAIQLPYATGANEVYIAFHRKRAPVIADDETEFEMPDPYPRDVLLPGLIARAQHDKEDVREEYAQMFREALARMCVHEFPQSSRTLRMPLAFTGVW